MSGRKVTHEIKLTLSLTIILAVIAFGLIANLLKPALSINDAFASGNVSKIAICTESGDTCANISKTGLYVKNSK